MTLSFFHSGRGHANFERTLAVYRAADVVRPSKIGGKRAIDPAWQRGAVAAPLSLIALASARFLWSVLLNMFRSLQPVSIALFVIIAAFVAGFVAFSEHVTTLQPPVLDKPADGIVVLTGGQSRISTALGLLRDKQGQRLLISGVHPSTNKKALQRINQADQSLFDCCIDLDRSALNTVGNATESERWIEANGYRSVIVVTNGYHIPRSILEMSTRMKDVKFIPYPVVNGDKRPHGWIGNGDELRILLVEYVKYLGAYARAGLSNLLGIDVESLSF